MKKSLAVFFALAVCLVAAATSIAAVPTAQDAGLSKAAAVRAARAAATREAGVQKVVVPTADWRLVSCKRTKAVADGFECRVVGSGGEFECQGKLIVQQSHGRIRTRNIDIGCTRLEY